MRDFANRYMQWNLKMKTERGFALVEAFCWTVAVLPLILASCTMVGPDYRQVKPDVNNDWQAEMEKGLNRTRPNKEIMAKWWQVFEDPLLIQLEKKGVKGNLDLKTSLSRIREARARRDMKRAPLFPTLDAGATAERRRSSETLGTPGGGDAHGYYRGGFDATWELDLFGQIRRSVQAAQAELEASQADLKDVLISLMADVALNYIQVRTYQHRLDIVRANIKTQKKTYELNKSRYECGIINELTVQQSLRNLEQSRSRIPALRKGLEAAKNRLCVLLGLDPGSLESKLIEMNPIPDIPEQLAVGIPAEALRRRPDLRRAERKLAAQTARIGVATADLYPKFQLGGTIGLESIDSSDFLEMDSGFWSIGPGMEWNIFQAGEIRLNIKIQTEKQKQALIHYRSVLLNAQEEVENALTDYAQEQTRLERLKDSVSAARRAENLARDQFQSGLVDFYNVLDAQRSLFRLQDELVQSKGEVAANVIRLYKALGGGWEYLDKLKDTGGHYRNTKVKMRMQKVLFAFAEVSGQ